MESFPRDWRYRRDEAPTQRRLRRCLETGVITGGHFSLKWDGVNRPVDAWNRDRDLASALKELLRCHGALPR